MKGDCCKDVASYFFNHFLIIFFNSPVEAIVG